MSIEKILTRFNEKFSFCYMKSHTFANEFNKASSHKFDNKL